MQVQDAQEKQDRFLFGVLAGTITAIFFTVGMGVVASANWPAGVASAAGSLAIAYIAKLVIQSRAVRA